VSLSFFKQLHETLIATKYEFIVVNGQTTTSKFHKVV